MQARSSLSPLHQQFNKTICKKEKSDKAVGALSNEVGAIPVFF
jgi:hypothetical protein